MNGINYPRWVAWGLVVLVFALAVLMGGCASREAQATDIIHEAKILLRDPHPEGPVWCAHRDTFLADADRWLGIAPETKESETR